MITECQKGLYCFLRSLLAVVNSGIEGPLAKAPISRAVVRSLRALMSHAQTSSHFASSINQPTALYYLGLQRRRNFAKALELKPGFH